MFQQFVNIQQRDKQAHVLNQQIHVARYIFYPPMRKNKTCKNSNVQPDIKVTYFSRQHRSS